MGPHGNPWEPMGTYGNPWGPMGTHGDMGTQRNLGDPMGSQGFPHGIPGGSPWDPRVGLWGPMGPWTRASGDSGDPLAKDLGLRGPGAYGDPWAHGRKC